MLVGGAVLVAAGCGRVNYDPIDSVAPTERSCSLELGPGEILCDDFEDGLENWDVLGPQSSANVENPHSGLRSLATLASSRDGSVGFSLPTPIDSGTYHLRTHILIPETLQVDGAIILLELLGDPKISLDLQVDGHLQLVTQTDVNRPRSEALLPRGRWFCLQLEMNIADSGGHVIAMVDGEVVVENLNADTRSSSPFETLWLGQRVSPTVSGTDRVYFDDLAFGTVPFECLP